MVVSPILPLPEAHFIITDDFDLPGLLDRALGFEQDYWLEIEAMFR